MRISDAGELQAGDDADGEWRTVTANAVCAGFPQHLRGLGGEKIIAYNLPLERGRSIIIRHVDGKYYDVDDVQNRLNRDLDANRHCIR